MNDPAPTDAAARADAAIRAVTSACDAAAAAIEAVPDPDVAFRYATEFWTVLRAAVDANGLLRARVAKRIWEVHKLDLVALADRLSVGKSRAGQFIQSARAQEQGEQT